MTKHGDYVPVSVVIPCFRCSKTISRAIDSILYQTVKPMEVILVDDASGDETLGVLREIENLNSRLIKVVLLDKNMGAASARNAGWAVASQPYVAFLDADDTWHPEKLCIQYDYLKCHPEVALCGHRCTLARVNDELGMLPNSVFAKMISSRSLLFRNAFSTPTVVVKRDIPFRFPDGKRYAEDVYLWQLIAFEKLKIARIELSLAFIHKAAYGAGGLSANIWRMELAELDNFFTHYRRGRIGMLILLTIVLFSVAKYFKRLAIYSMRYLFRVG
ncbi:MAG: glycosyltransferase family 2 protein [Gallionella sp.]|nr:glycosyltransferase family 2 protein [Gallionella sp.]